MVALEAVSLFRHLSQKEMARLYQIAQERRFSVGQEIFGEGDTGDGVYVVKDGLVEISGVLRANVRHAFSQLGPGEIFGEMAVIESLSRSATATAVKETTVYYIPRGDMLDLIENSPALSLRLLQEISRRLREFDQLYLKEVVQAERLTIVGRFARSIIHDLKNPLSVISLTAELVGTDKAAPEFRQQAAQRIRDQVDRINDLIGEILTFTQGANETFVLGQTNYRAFVQRLVEEIRSEAEMKGAGLELESQPPDVNLSLNPKRLARVFHNLIHNATDAMPDGGKVILRFSTSPTEVVTELEDTGSGIAPEITSKLFEAFATHGKEHGSGLGLSICKKIVEDHHGRIWARNEPGRGAVFAFALPLPKKVKP